MIKEFLPMQTNIKLEVEIFSSKNFKQVKVVNKVCLECDIEKSLVWQRDGILYYLRIFEICILKVS